MAGLARRVRLRTTGGLALAVGMALTAYAGLDAAAEAAPSPTERGPDRPPVLAGLDDGAGSASEEGVTRALAGPIRTTGLGPRVSVAVRDLNTGTVLYGKEDAAAYTPASTTKLVTAASVLQELGPDHRFTTSVRATNDDGADGATDLTLVGGGDPMLATGKAKRESTGHTVASDAYPPRASVDDLAARTAKQLKADGTTTVRLRYDDSLFTQPESPNWESGYVGSVVAPITALWVDEGRANWPYDTPRDQDPSATATAAFAKALARNGITTRGEPDRQEAPKGADEIASIESPPVQEIVEHTVRTSDNDAAEVLGKHVALARDKPTTFAGTAAALRGSLGELDVDFANSRLRDASGLSRDNRLTADLLTDVIGVAASSDHPKLRGTLTGLPVAGFNGSLRERYVYTDAASAAGYVRGKTGTLTGVSSLAGVVTTKDGQALSYAVLTDKVTKDARPGIDAITAALAGCGCS